MPGWYKVCQIGRSEQQVHLQQFVAFGVQGAGLETSRLLANWYKTCFICFCTVSSLNSLATLFKISLIPFSHFITYDKTYIIHE